MSITFDKPNTGAVDTELQRHLPQFLGFLMKGGLKYFFKTPIEGAQTQIRMAVDPELEDVTGKYFTDCEITTEATAAQDDDTAEWLWNKSKELVGI